MNARAHRWGAVLLVPALVLAVPAQALGPNSSGTAEVGRVAPPFTPDDLLLLETTVGSTRLTDSLGAYSSRAGVFLPLGELSRLLDFAIVVDPAERSASGWFLDPARTFSLDLGARTVRSDGRDFQFGPQEAALVDDELYVRTDVLGRWLPLAFEPNRSESTLRIVTGEKLAFELKRERDGRRKGLDQGPAPDRPTRRVASPYAAWSPPAVDVNLSLGAANDEPERTLRWDLRVAGDLAYMGLQAYVASDESGAPESARMSMERRALATDGSGALTGPAVSAGDIFTPLLGLGMSSRGGRGFAYSSTPRSQSSVFDAVDLRGEMPSGFEAELYVNEVLRASQPAPIAGRYEFAGVPLAFGLNVIRIVFYGPRGERFEDVRNVNVGGGQLARGQTTVDFGAVDQGVPMVSVRGGGDDDATGLDPGFSTLAYSAQLAHGLTRSLTARIGVGRYTPFPDDTRDLFNVGLAAAAGRYAVQFDVSADSGDGRAASLGVAGTLGHLPVVLRHVEYAGGYADENSGSAIDAANPLTRLTDLRADFDAPLPLTTRTLPASFTARHEQRNDGSTDTSLTGQVTSSLGHVLLSSGLAWRHLAPARGNASDVMSGTLDFSTRLGGQWQLRGNVAYDLLPGVEPVTTALTVDRNLSARTSLRLGVQQDWTETRYTTVTGGFAWRWPSLDVTFGGSYVSGLDLWSAGLQFSTGSLFDPLRRGYRGVRPGATTGGALALEAFVDANGDGRRQSSEAGLAGLRLQTNESAGPADSRGRVLATGLGDAGLAHVGLDLQSIEDPYLHPPAEVVEVATRPGHVAVARLPFHPQGEATVRFLLEMPQGATRGLSAVEVELLDARGLVVATGRTEYDGTVLFENLAPGSYAARIAPAQATRLRMSLAGPVPIAIAAGGGYAGTFDARVRIER